MAVVGAAIMIVGCFCPMALFRLLAFVDPGTGSGASLRSTLHANGGVRGLLTRPGGASGDTASPGAATQTAPDGRAASEQAADAETGNRFQAAAARVVPVAGRGIAGTMRLLGDVASQAVSVGVDVTGQAGIGSSGYYDAGGTHGPAPRRHAATPTPPTRPDPRLDPQPAPRGPWRGRPAATPSAQPAHPGPARAGADRQVPRRAGGAAGLADDAVFLA